MGNEYTYKHFKTWQEAADQKEIDEKEFGVKSELIGYPYNDFKFVWSLRYKKEPPKTIDWRGSYTVED